MILHYEIFGQRDCVTCSDIDIGLYGTAINFNTTATGKYSFASGNGTKALGENSIAFGYLSEAQLPHSIAIGHSNFSLGDFGLTLGQSNTVNTRGIAIGQRAEATGEQSIAIGRFVKATGLNSFVIGESNNGNELINPFSHSLMIGFYSKIPSIFVEAGADYNTAGNVGIGTVSPQSLLHIEGDTRIGSRENMANLYVSSLTSTKDFGVIISDPSGKLSIIEDFKLLGDNLGDHIATQDVVLGEFGLTYSFGTSPGLTLTKTNDIYVAKNMSVNENFTVSGGIYGYTPALSENWNKLEIFGSTLPDAAKIEVCDGSGDNWRSIKFLTRGTTADFQFYIDSKVTMRIRSNKVEMGSSTVPTGLNVYGMINAREVKVSLDSWSDYVFEPGYKLRNLLEVENFILNQGHLPDVPSASKVIENGLNLGEMDALLLKKVEELTLYVIELHKNNEKMKGEIENLRANVSSIQNK